MWEIPHQWSTSCVLVIQQEGHPDIAEQLDAYFKDKNRSGGGPLHNDLLFINQYNAVVCFADPEGLYGPKLGDLLSVVICRFLLFDK